MRSIAPSFHRALLAAGALAATLGAAADARAITVTPVISSGGPFPSPNLWGVEINSAVVPPGITCPNANGAPADALGRFLMEYGNDSNLRVVPLDCAANPTSMSCNPRMKQITGSTGNLPATTTAKQNTATCSQALNGQCSCTTVQDSTRKIQPPPAGYADSQIMHLGNGTIAWFTFSSTIRSMGSANCATATVNTGLDGSGNTIQAGAHLFISYDCGFTWSYAASFDPTVPESDVAKGADTSTDAYRAYWGDNGYIYFGSHDQMWRIVPSYNLVNGVFVPVFSQSSVTRLKRPQYPTNTWSVANLFAYTRPLTNPSDVRLVLAKCLGGNVSMRASSNWGDTWAAPVTGAPCSGFVSNGTSVRGLNVNWPAIAVAPDYSSNTSVPTYLIASVKRATNTGQTKEYLFAEVRRYTIDASNQPVLTNTWTFGAPGYHVVRLDMIAPPADVQGQTLGGPVLRFDLAKELPPNGTLSGPALATATGYASYVTQYNGTSWSGTTSTVQWISAGIPTWTGSITGTKIVDDYQSIGGEFDLGSSYFIPAVPGLADKRVRYMIPFNMGNGTIGVEYTMVDFFPLGGTRWTREPLSV